MLGTDVGHTRRDEKGIDDGREVPDLDGQGNGQPDPAPRVRRKFAELWHRRLSGIPNVQNDLRQPGVPDPLVPFGEVVDPPPVDLRPRPLLVPVDEGGLETDVPVGRKPAS